MNLPPPLPKQLSLWEPPAPSKRQLLVAGVDEVGRGCLFGPVVAAAVILPLSAEAALIAAGVRDSKQLTASRRCNLAGQIRQVAIAISIGMASVREIDRLNILQASLLAMKRAILKLKVQPELCLIDGNQRIRALNLPQETIVSGDSKSLVIASASIVAKVWRDDLIVRLGNKYPQYDLTNNKGYGTPKHLLALQQYGRSPLHRISFTPCRDAR